jgi:hypothetical protein
MMYASRLLAESWDSTNLYWARLVDEKGFEPVTLNILVPELTRRMIGKISATHPDDWPAVLRAMRETGEDFRAGKLAPPAGAGSASGFSPLPVGQVAGTLAPAGSRTQQVN